MSAQFHTFNDTQLSEACASRRPSKRPTIIDACPMRLQRAGGKTLHKIVDKAHACDRWDEA